MPRTTAQRIADVRARLHDEVNLWVSSASATGEAYLIPLSFVWDGMRVTLATPAASRTARNLVRAGFTRMALAATNDVVILEGPVIAVAADETDPAIADAFTAKAEFDARRQREPYLYLQMTPRRILAWRGPDELAGRVVMHEGRWLADAR
jgi:hypothetical protein